MSCWLAGPTVSQRQLPSSAGPRAVSRAPPLPHTPARARPAERPPAPPRAALAHHRHARRIRHLPQQRDQIRGRPGQQAARQQHLAGEAVAHHPEHLMSNVGLQTIQRQDHPPLLCQQPAQPIAVAQRRGQQFVVAVEQVGHAPLGDRHPPLAQHPVDLRHAAVVAMAQHPGQCDDVQPELVPGQRHRAFRLRPVGMGLTHAAIRLAAPDLQPKPHRAGQCHQRAIILVADAHERAAGRTQLLLRLQHIFSLRPLPRRCPGHPRLLPVRHLLRQNYSRQPALPP